MAERFILVLDEGTTSTRAMLFTPAGECVGIVQKELEQNYPRPGWVEHDADEIWRFTLHCARTCVKKAGGAQQIIAIGITNQRETIVFWDKKTGQPLGPAIVWQDRRTAALCEGLKERGYEKMVQAKTGLLLDPYFSGSKIAWALESWPQLKEAGDNLAIGTIESWLVWKLTGGAHLSDATNASRTALMDIHQGKWAPELLDLFGVPHTALPEITDCAGQFGETLAEHFGAPIPITGMAGDQQAASIGQACLAPGDTKATYGTGAFVLTNTGTQAKASEHRLLTTIAWRLNGVTSYALEGSVFVAGSLIKWLRDSIGLLVTADESEEMARSVPDNGGVGTPVRRAAITGLSFAANSAHIVRAALEAMAYQTHDLMTAFAADGAAWAHLKIDGGMSANDWLAQDMADILDLPVERPGFVETTALGAAMLAAIGCGHYATLEEAAHMREGVRTFKPAMEAEARDKRLAAWRHALDQVLG